MTEVSAATATMSDTLNMVSEGPEEHQLPASENDSVASNQPQPPADGAGPKSSTSGAMKNTDILSRVDLSFPALLGSARSETSGGESVVLEGDDLDRLMQLKTQTRELLRAKVMKISAAEAVAREIQKPTGAFSGLGETDVAEAEQVAAQSGTEIQSQEAEVLQVNEALKEKAKVLDKRYNQYKRSAEEASGATQRAASKRARVEESSLDLQARLGGVTESESLPADLASVDGCRRILDAQEIRMKSMKDEEASVVEQAMTNASTVEALKVSVAALRQAAANSGDGSDAESAAVQQELVQMTQWYESVNAIVTNLAGIELEASSFSGESLSFRLTSFDVEQQKQPFRLIINFQPGTTKISNASLEPDVAPLSDVVAWLSSAAGSSIGWEDGANIRHVIREARTRMQSSFVRAKELEELNRRFVVQAHFGGVRKDTAPGASAWVYYHITEQHGLVAVLRVPPDYPQPHSRVEIFETIGVMGWTRADVQALKGELLAGDRSTVAAVADALGEFAKRNFKGGLGDLPRALSTS